MPTRTFVVLAVGMLAVATGLNHATAQFPVRITPPPEHKLAAPQANTVAAPEQAAAVPPLALGLEVAIVAQRRQFGGEDVVEVIDFLQTNQVWQLVEALVRGDLGQNPVAPRRPLQAFRRRSIEIHFEM